MREGRPEALGLRLQAQRSLLGSLFVELFQTERSAVAHPRREARRYAPEDGPAEALRAVSQHAESMLPELTRIAEERQLGKARAGTALGEALSRTRQLVLDRLVESERSYRGTLAGMRHGIDLVELVRSLADEASDDGLVDLCDRWLSERRPLVERAARELCWFARHPERALHR